MSTVEIVGILNLTPDSFSKDGVFTNPKLAISRTNEMFRDGASIVDVGAESTRPWAIALTSEQEQERLSPVLGEIVYTNPGQISLDTYHPETLEMLFKKPGT